MVSCIMCNVSDCSNKFVSLPVTETDTDMLYPIGIQNFEKIRKEGYIYVDKTAIIHRLATTGTYYFLSRPRRFGKSLLVSTMEAYFKGKKELFEGLAMEQLEKGYAKPFVNDTRKIFKIGVSFSTENRRIEEWKVIE